MALRILTTLLLAAAALPAQTANICDRTPQVRDAILEAVGASGCSAVDADAMASVSTLSLGSSGLASLKAGDFDGLTGLRTLYLNHNALTALPAGVFDDPYQLQTLYLSDNALTTLQPGAFNGLRNLRTLYLQRNPLTTLPAGVFDGLIDLELLGLSHNPLMTTLPAGVFDGLGDLRTLYLQRNQLTTLPAGVFDGLTRLESLHLQRNQLTALPAGVFDGLGNLRTLYLQRNQLTALPAGAFDGLTGLRWLELSNNALTALRAGVFDDLGSLEALYLSGNHLVGLTRDDPLFAKLPSGAAVYLGGQTPVRRERKPPTRLAAAVPLMLAAHPSRQGFARIVNESDESGSVRVFAFDDGGHAPEPIDIRLGGGQVVHFNSNDLEDGNPNKGIERGVGAPVQGDWRLDVETALPVRVLAFVRTSDGFLTAMHDVLPRNDGRLVAQTFNPGSNIDQESKLRLVNTGEDAADVSIEGVDDQGNAAGPVTLTLAGGESRTLSAFDLENGAGGLAGTLGDGAGKWRLFIDAGSAVVGASLLDAATGHLTNISTTGAALE